MRLKIRCWLLRRLLGDSFVLIVSMNKAGTLPIIPAGTGMAIQFGSYGLDELPVLCVDDFYPIDHRLRAYVVSFLAK